MVLGVALAGAVFTTVLHGAAPGPNLVTFRALSAGFFFAAGIAAIGAVVAATAKRPLPVDGPSVRTKADKKHAQVDFEPQGVE
jgi:hypothetical protein